MHYLNDVKWTSMKCNIQHAHAFYCQKRQAVEINFKCIYMSAGITQQRVKQKRSVTNQRLHVNVKSLCSSEIWINPIFVQYYLCDTFFNQLVI